MVTAPDDVGDEPRPPRLVGRAEAGPVVAVEVLMKKEVVAPPRIGLEPLYATEARPSAILVDEEKRDESARFALGLGCVDVLNIGFEKVDEIDDFAARVRKVPRQA